MGTIQHDVVIATVNNDSVQDKIEDYIFNNDFVGKVVRHTSGINNVKTYILGPDGANENCDDSDKGDELRKRFITFLETFTYEDGSSPVSWVEVSYGELGQRLVQGNNKYRSIEDEQGSLISESARKIYGDNYKGHQLRALQYHVDIGSFPWALNLIKNGYKLTRRQWNVKGQFIFIIENPHPHGCEISLGVKKNPAIAIKGTDGCIQVGWLASQADMLADDWELVEG